MNVPQMKQIKHSICIHPHRPSLRRLVCLVPSNRISHPSLWWLLDGLAHANNGKYIVIGGRLSINPYTLASSLLLALGLDILTVLGRAARLARILLLHRLVIISALISCIRVLAQTVCLCGIGPRACTLVRRAARASGKIFCRAACVVFAVGASVVRWRLCKLFT